MHIHTCCRLSWSSRCRSVDNMTSMTISPKSKSIISNPSNPDLQPTSPARQTSTAWEMAGIWMSLMVSVPSFYIAGSLVEKGMAWWQGISIIVASAAILLFPLLLTSQPGALYGVPFPVFARSAFGIRGAHVPALLRSFIGCGWFGIDTWMGGQAIYILLPSSLTELSYACSIPWLGTSPLELSCFAVFWLVQMVALWKGMRGIRQLEKYSAPVLIMLLLLLLAWAYVKAGGFGPMLSQPSMLSPSEFWSLFFPSLTASVGNWAGMALSIPDFARYARSQKDQVLGQLGLPLFMGSYAFIGLVVTSSTVVIFGRVISNPIDLLAAIGGTFVKVFAVPGVCLAILTTNVPANLVAPANTLVNLSPSTFSFKSGAIVSALIGAILFQPWKILKSPDSFVYTWLVGFSAILGPISGVLLSDYYLLRGTVLDINDLYSISPNGSYYYSGGYNFVALACLVMSWVPVVPGFLHKVGMVKSVPRAFVFIYNTGWFFGFLVGGMLYLLLFCCIRRHIYGSHDWKFKAQIKGKIDTAPTTSSLTDPILP